jgi:hypothetical protein
MEAQERYSSGLLAYWALRARVLVCSCALQTPPESPYYGNMTRPSGRRVEDDASSPATTRAARVNLPLHAACVGTSNVHCQRRRGRKVESQPSTNATMRQQHAALPLSATAPCGQRHGTVLSKPGNVGDQPTTRGRRHSSLAHH